MDRHLFKFSGRLWWQRKSGSLVSQQWGWQKTVEVDAHNPWCWRQIEIETFSGKIISGIFFRADSVLHIVYVSRFLHNILERQSYSLHLTEGDISNWFYLFLLDFYLLYFYLCVCFCYDRSLENIVDMFFCVFETVILVMMPKLCRFHRFFAKYQEMLQVVITKKHRMVRLRILKLFMIVEIKVSPYLQILGTNVNDVSELLG